MNEEYMTVKEVADYLSLTESTIRRYLQSGTLTRHKIFNSTVVERKEVEEYKKRRDGWFKSR